MTEIITDPATGETGPKSFQCRHIHHDGRRCGSPCLRLQPFCYHHHTTRKPIQNPRARLAETNRRAAFDLPLPEDRSAIQFSIGEILRRIAANQLDPKRAGLLLYGLQIAATNLPPQPRPAAEEPARTRQTVEEVVEDDVYGPLAPEAELNVNPAAPKSLERILMERWEKDKEAYTRELSTPDRFPTWTGEGEDGYANQPIPRIQAVAAVAHSEVRPIIPASPKRIKRNSNFHLDQQSEGYRGLSLHPNPPTHPKLHKKITHKRPYKLPFYPAFSPLILVTPCFSSLRLASPARPISIWPSEAQDIAGAVSTQTLPLTPSPTKKITHKRPYKLPFYPAFSPLILVTPCFTRPPNETFGPPRT